MAWSGEIAAWRLNCLRGGYLFISAGLGGFIWPDLIDHVSRMELMHGTVACMLGALSLLSLLGLKYPLQMLPLLFWEMTWKGLWLLGVALPQWREQRMDAATADWAFACIMVVVFPLLVPWSYVFRHYVRKPADSWRPRACGAAVIEGDS